MTDAIVVFCTCASRDEAERIATTLVGEALAACGQILPGIRSIYRWQGKIEVSDETLMLLKTTAGQFERLQARISELHSYETPEVLAVPASAVAEKYLSWLQDSGRESL